MTADSTLPPEAPDRCLTLEELLPRLRRRLKVVFFRQRIPAQETEDIVQEALLSAVRHWDQIRDKEAWLLGTIRIRCAIYWKRQRMELLQAVDLPTLEYLSRPVPPPQTRDEMLWDLETLTSELSPRHRTVLRLRFALGMSTREVAEQLGYCPTSVRKLVARFLERLQKELDGADRLSA
ncbi:MAG TPA: sigma-70 family RNA polymerase sigma factor [Thermoanaerobaculia bacterium]